MPLTPDDLPGFAGRNVRLAATTSRGGALNRWRLLQAPDAGPEDSELYADIVNAMATAVTRSPTDLPPADLIILIPNMAAAWVSTPDDRLTAVGRRPDEPV